MKFITFFVIISFINYKTESFGEKNVEIVWDQYDPRSFFFLPPIIPINTLKRRRNNPQKERCIGDCGLDGICSAKSECTNFGGTASGLCSDNVVCCIFYRKCGNNTSADVTYFVNPDYPNMNQGGSRCLLKVVKANPKICQLRLDFKELTLIQPSADGKCENDFFTVSSCLTNRICGDNKGQHMYVDFPEGADMLTLSIDTNAAKKGGRKWNVEIRQIGCDSSLLAPSGCLMYFTGTSGSVSSFNYGEPQHSDNKKNRHIRGLNYGICIQSKDQYCSIEWTTDVDPYSFTISGNASLIDAEPNTIDRELRGIECKNNFIVIADPFRNDTLLDTDRFCGLSFKAITTSVKPFVLYAITGQNKTLNSKDEGNRGFKLNYRQLPCRN